MSQLLRIALVIGALFAVMATCAPTMAVTQYIGSAAIPGTGIDASGLNNVLENGLNANNTLNGFGSALAYTGYNNRYIFLPDRGPNATAYPGGAAVDNTVSWANRYQIFDLTFTPTGGGMYDVGHSFAGTTILKNEAGQTYIGKSDAFAPGSPNNPINNLRMDPEGIRVGFNGEVYLSDEYGPIVYRFDQSGARTGTFNVPDYYTIANPNSLAATENSNAIVPFATDPRRITNRGMESMAISPDGSKLFGMMQNSLQQEGGTGGNKVRILEWNTANPGGTPREFVYQLEAGNRVISEFVAINDHEFLVVERDQLAGTAAVFKRVYRIDLTGATDVAGTVDLDLISPTLVQKSLFMDLINGTGIDPASFAKFKQLLTNATDFDLFPEKIEGIAFGPVLPDGRLSLLISNDNDFLTINPNFAFAFAIDTADLSTYESQQFTTGLVFGPIPEPATMSLGLLGLAMLARRRRA